MLPPVFGKSNPELDVEDDDGGTELDGGVLRFRTVIVWTEPEAAAYFPFIRVAEPL